MNFFEEIFLQRKVSVGHVNWIFDKPAEVFTKKPKTSCSMSASEKQQYIPPKKRFVKMFLRKKIFSKSFFRSNSKKSSEKV